MLEGRTYFMVFINFQYQVGAIIKQFAFAALFSVCASTAVFAGQADLESTALNVVLADNPLADLAAPTTIQTIAARKAEIKNLFDTYLTPEGQASFYQAPPFVLGEILVAFDQPTTATIMALYAGHESPVLTVTAQGVGVPAVDALLAKHGVKEIVADDLFFTLKFDPKHNPNPVAADFKALPLTKFAEPDGIMNMRGFDLAHVATTPAVYILTYGTGDCPSGCIEKRRFYFEAGFVHGQDYVAKIGEAGDEISAEDRASLFKN